jgi:hypothetical protein
MRLFVISILTIFISVAVYAGDFFTDAPLKDLRVVEVDKETQSAWIRDKNGNEAEVYIGDTIGIDAREVIIIDDASVTVRFNNTNTKLPLIISNEEAEQNALDIDTSLAD